MRRSALEAERVASISAARAGGDSESTLVDDLLDQAAAGIAAAAEDVEMARAPATPEPEPQPSARPPTPPSEVTPTAVASGAAVLEVVAPGEISDGDLDEDLPDAVLTEEASEDPDGAEGDVSPLAQTLAHMAATFQTKQTEEEIEISDAPLLPLPPEALALDPPPVRGSTPPPLPIGIAQVVAGIPEALAERPRRPKRAKPWFEEVFDEDYLRTLPFMTPEQTLREVDFIEACLAVPAGGEVLDVGCGYGRHAIELVQRGLSVTGVDLSLPLLIRAADESQRRALAVNFVHSDMREMAFERQFDGAYSMLTSFGYFDEESNLKVAEGVARALKPGGRFLVDVLNRDYVVADLPARVWWEGDGCVVLEEVDFNFNTSRIITHRSVVFEDGRQLEQEISVRAYSLHELGKLLRHAGFRVREVSGSIPTRGHFFGSTSRNLIVLAEKRGD